VFFLNTVYIIEWKWLRSAHRAALYPMRAELAS